MPKHCLVLGLLLAGAGSALAAPANCPLAGVLPNYAATDPPVTRAYDAVEFTVHEADEDKPVTVTGRTCKQYYTLKDGVQPLSNLEIQTNYRQQLPAAGAKIVYADDSNTVARTDDNPPTWIRVWSQESEIDITTARPEPHRQTLTAPSGKDWKRLGHMPDYVAGDLERRNYDKLEFTVQDGDDSKTVVVMGEKYVLPYTERDGTVRASNLDIQENYRTALKALGAEILFTDASNTTARMMEAGRVAWLRVWSQENEVDVSVIEEKPFQASIQTPKEDAMRAALEKEGHIALYINFDFAKSEIRPESAPVIAQVVQLLKDNPSLKVAIEGHTDSIGGHDYNMALSATRAQAVVAAVTAAGIKPDRLTAAGYGPDKPIADNASDEGRARNRRVELVKS